MKSLPRRTSGSGFCAFRRWPWRSLNNKCTLLEGQNLPQTSDVLHLLFVGLPCSDKLGEYLETEGKLVPTSQRGIGREALPDKVCSVRKQAGSCVCIHELSQLLVQLLKGDQSALEQRNSDGNVVFTLEASQ